MRTTFLVLLLLLSGTASMSVAQGPSFAPNTWNNGAPMPIALDDTALAVLENQIYVVGGGDGTGKAFANTQIYNPTTNTWSEGDPLPTPTLGGCAGVVNNVLYFVGGRLTEYQFTGVVWAYSPETKTWSSKATMPTARISVVCVVENGLINVMGGYNGSFLSTVESYNPATDTWTEEAPMLSPESDVSAALIGNTILVANGSGGWVDGHNQSYNAATNTWTFLNSDPTLRQGSCSGSIGPRLYSAGGWDDVHGDALTLTESFTLSTGAWKTLAPMPQGTMGLGRSVVYGERLYCFGGEYSNNGTPVHNLAIYQP